MYDIYVGAGRHAQALGILIANKALIKAGVCEVGVLPHHASDDCIVELGAPHVGPGEVHAVHDSVCQVRPCDSHTATLGGRTWDVEGIIILPLYVKVYECNRTFRT